MDTGGRPGIGHLVLWDTRTMEERECNISGDMTMTPRLPRTSSFNGHPQATRFCTRTLQEYVMTFSEHSGDCQGLQVGQETWHCSATLAQC